MYQRFTTLLLLLVVVGLLAGGSLHALAAPDAQTPTTFRGDVRVTDDLDVDDDLNVDGDAAVDDTFNIDDTVVTISGTQTVTPTYSVMTVAPSVASTITLATGSAEAGDFLLVLNTVATNTNIVDTGATAGGAAIDLGANDIALFIYLNSKWVEIASPDNS